jgi:hypothetical protein
MSSVDDRLDRRPDPSPESKLPAVSRRRFLGLGGAAAAALASGASLLRPAAANAQPADGLDDLDFKRGSTGGAGDVRRQASFQFRQNAATYWKNQPVKTHPVNGDETRYATRIANFSKGLAHNSFGEVDPSSYQSLLTAATSGKPADFAAIPLDGPMRLTDPQGGLAFDLEGADSYAIAVPPPPALASAEMAGEAVELYWAALLRDVNFLDYGTDPTAAAAVADLNRFGADFKGAKVGGKVLPRTLFRDPLPGTLNGPYLSQLMLLSTPFGADFVERRMRTFLPGTDHLTAYDSWLATQNGALTETYAGQGDGDRRYIRNGRDLATWLHLNTTPLQAFFSASLILLTLPNDDPTANGLACPLNPGNPYLNDLTQAGYTTFGAPYIQGLMCEVATRALKVAWHKKWQVHRRLRPEEWGGLVHNQRLHNRYPGVIEARQLNSPALDQVFSQYGTYLLPQAYPEGCPTDPSYVGGYATVAGACVTILKAMFDERFVILNPVVPSSDGLSLLHYQGPPLTVGGELNKLASNVATGRNLAGVNWRSDAREGLNAGEALALSILRDQKAGYNEVFKGFTFTRFDGSTVTM